MTDLLKQRVLEDYLEEVHGDNGDVTSRNRAFSRLSNLVTYCRREFALEGTSPFHHQTLNPQGVGKLDGAPAPARRDVHRARGQSADQSHGEARRRRPDARPLLLRRRRRRAARRDARAAESTTGIIRTPGKGLGYSLRFLWTTTKSGKQRDVPITTDRLLQFVLERSTLEFPFGNLDGSRLR